MSYNREDYIRIKEEFSQKYRLARAEAEKRRQELHMRIPAVWELDRMLSRTGMEIMSAIGSGSDAERALAEVRARNEDMLRERARILRENGYPADYSDVQYSCPHCGDTGFVETRMCECMKRALVEAGYQSSGIGGLIRTQSFENFSLAYYHEDQKKVSFTVEALKSFAMTFDESTYRNHLLVGGTGLGKTHLSTSVAKVVIERGFDVLYVTSVGMINDFESKRFGDGSEARNSPVRYTEAELLIIDDLGTEMTNQFTLSCIYDVINERINRRLSTMISTNLSPKELEARYGERIFSRICGEYRPLVLSGSDIRKQKR